MKIVNFNDFINEELTGIYKDETEIIYKDKNIVCLIPKSQMTSNIYGKNANWCQTTKGGFTMWSKKGDESNLLIRFLIKDGGRKVRFTYFANKEFYWANETGWHVLSGKGNPFEVKAPSDKIRDIEQDILNLIKNNIPKECKDKVLDFIDKNLKTFKYIYRDKEYTDPRLQKTKDAFDEIKLKYKEKLKKNDDIEISYSTWDKIFTIRDWGKDTGSDYLSNVEKFSNPKEFEQRLKEILDKNE